ncbi:MAG: TonB-dependent receptor [Acidobacteria bacterium]|nr:TonB-dependent receptor [Acidobacteriota bacterium]MBI3664565.1 TonB-dependent receptor [Acidobacteriota bacterium]
MKNRCVGALLVALLVFSAGAWAQVSTSSISGTVLDKTGAVVAGAKVSLKNEATGIVQETKTTDAGSYSFASLLPGSYTIAVEMQGFQKWVSTKNPVNVGAPTHVDATLEVGAVTSVVEVESTFERLATSNASLGGVIGRKEITELPLNGRNPLNLIVLEPGLVQRTGGSAGSGTHVFGSRDRAHNVTIDGIDANESSVPNPQSNIYRLTPDNVQEYRVTTHNATPEFGRNSGANVTIATRSGGNDFHGDAIWYHRNTILNSNEWFSNSAGKNPLTGQDKQPRPTLLLHQFGGDLSGPIIKNKLFFFVSYQNNRIKQAQPITQSFGVPIVYTAAARGGVFRYVKGCINLVNQANCVSSPSDPNNIKQNSTALVDTSGNLKTGVPVCALPASVDCVASYNIFTSDPAGIGGDPLTMGLVNSLPVPNDFSVGDGLNTAGFLWNTPSRFKGPFYMARADYQIDSNNNIFGRMLWSIYNTSEGDLLNGRPKVYPGFNPLGEVNRTSQNLAIGWKRVISPQIVNDLTVGYSRFNFFFSLVESNKVSGTLAAIGQNCFGASSFSNISTPYCNTPHTARAVSNIQYIDNLSYTHGAHMFRGGFNIRMYRHNDSRGVPGGFNMSPTVIFSQSIRSPFSSQTWPTAANCPPVVPPAIPCLFPSAAGINTAADNPRLLQTIVEMVGIPARVAQAFQADLAGDVYTATLFTLGTRSKQFDFYLQDEWKVRRNLTVTYGVRWEWNMPPKDCCDRAFVPDKNVDGSQGAVTFKKASSWFGRDNARAIAPRISLAWQPFANGKTVVRAGWGVSFDTLSTFQVTSIGGKVPGSTLQCNVDVQATPGVCGDIPNNLRISGLVAALNPLALPIPTATPSTQFSPANAPQGVAPSVGAFDPNLKVPTVHQWDLTIQRELPWGFTVEAGYIGRRGTRLYRAYDLNQIRTDQTGLLTEFLAAQQNIFICKNNAAACLAAQTAAGISAASQTVDNFANFGLPGQQPLLLLAALLGSGAAPAGLTSSQWRGTNASNVLLNGLGDLATRIDSQSGTGLITLRTNPSTGVAFPANYFRPNPQFSQIFYFDSGGSSIYHGAILNVRRRFSRGLAGSFSWTFSKSIDDMSVDPVGAVSGGALSTSNSRTPTDVRNFKLDRARSDFDNKHVITTNWLYDLPFGKGQRWGSSVPAFLNQIIGDWELTGIFFYQSGEPFTINSGVRTVHNTKQSRAEIRGPMIQPQLQPPPSTATTVRGPVVWNVGALINVPTDPNYNCRNVLQGGNPTSTFFCIPAPGQSGSGRNIAQGPHIWNFDFGVRKKFALTERVKLNFYADFFNILNHANFENPRNASVGSPTLTSSVFGQTCCVAASTPSSATVIAVGEPNRVIQFGFKIAF